MGSSVPKCNGCEFHSYDTTDGGRFGYLEGQQRYNWCRLHEIKDGKFFTGNDRLVKASEAKTSPKWCPKRKIVNA